MKSGKVTLGYKSTLKSLRSGKAKLVIIAGNSRNHASAETELFDEEIDKLQHLHCGNLSSNTTQWYGNLLTETKQHRTNRIPACKDERPPLLRQQRKYSTNWHTLEISLRTTAASAESGGCALRKGHLGFGGFELALTHLPPKIELGTAW